MSRVARQPAPKKKKTKASAKRSRPSGGRGGGIRIATLAKKYGVDVGSSSAAKPAFQTAKVTKKKPKKKVAKKLRQKLAVDLMEKQSLLSSMFPEPLLNLLRYLALKKVDEEEEEEELIERRRGSVFEGGGGGGSEDIVYAPGQLREANSVVTDVWCPVCRHKLSPREVVEGFQSGSIDYRTTCPSCEHRFQTTFAFSKTPGFRFVWLCEEQTLDQYDLWLNERRPFHRGHGNDDIATALMTERPEIFFNAYRYGCMEHEDPKQRVIEFLGIGKESMEEKEEEEDADDEEEEE